MSAPFITVVMPVRNEARFIRQTLMQVLGQDYPADRFEVLVADGMSDDGTREIVEELSRDYPQLRLLDNPARLSSAGRNVGFQKGRGDYFLVVDGHCYLPTDQLLKNLAECFGKSGAHCLGRPQPLDPPELTVFQKAVALARGSRLGHGGDSLIYGEYEGFADPTSNGAAYRREVFERVGYLDESFDAAEDVEFNYRVRQGGLLCYTSPSLTVRYYPRESLKGLFRQMQRYGKGRRRFVRKHPEALTLNQLIPALFVGGLLLLALALILSGLPGVFPQPVGAALRFLAWSLSLLYLAYLGAVLVESLRCALRHGWGYLIHLVPVFATVHLGLGWGFLCGHSWFKR